MKWCKKHRDKKKRLRTLNSESGQGAVEYILIVVITMVLILGLVYNFNYKFKAFAEQYFGSYIACLLEVGELPGNQGGVCAEEYQTIAQQTGKQLLKFPPSSPIASAPKSASSPPSSSSSSSPARGEALSSNSRQTSNFNNAGGSGSGRERSSNVNGAGSKKDANASGYATLYSSNGSYDRGTANGQGVSGKKYYMSSGDGEEEDVGKKAVSKTDKKSANNNALKPKRVSQDAVRRIASTGEVVDSQFTFGAFIRWIIVGALILIIVIFFGGQLLQIMRSRDKGGGD